MVIGNPKKRKREASAYKVKVALYCFDFEATIFVHLDLLFFFWSKHLDLLDQLKFLSLLDKGLCCGVVIADLQGEDGWI